MQTVPMLPGDVAVELAGDGCRRQVVVEAEVLLFHGRAVEVEG